MSVTDRLIEGARGIEWSALPSEVQLVAGHCFLDWLGCTIAGAHEPLSGILRREVAASDRAEEATLLGVGGRTSALTAALVNGAAGHALDFDDTHSTMSGHPSVPVVPVALALGERDGRAGADVLAAVVAGIETECRVGALIAGPHYRAGWHATGTLGTIGAAAAGAHLLGLDHDGWAFALGLAATQAAGLKANFGTMAKPFHAGRAAQSGLLAALLARGGFTANPDILAAKQGFVDVLGAGRGVEERRLDPWEGRYATRETLFKYHAACYLTHAPINALAELRREGPLDADRVEAVEIRIEPPALDVCNIAEPATGLEGKFSLRATAAMTLLGDDMADLATYTDERVRAPAVVALRDRVKVVADPAQPPMSASVSLSLAGGETRRGEADTITPAEDLTWQGEQLRSKFVGLVRAHLGEERAAALAEAADRLGDAPSISSLTRLASGLG